MSSSIQLSFFDANGGLQDHMRCVQFCCHFCSIEWCFGIGNKVLWQQRALKMQLLHFGCWWYSYGEVCKKFSGTRQVSSTHSPAVYPKKASTYDMHRDSAACTFSSLYQKIRGTFDKTLFIGHTATKRVFLLTSLKQPFLSSTVWFWRRKLRP